MIIALAQALKEKNLRQQLKAMHKFNRINILQKGVLL